MLVLLVADLPAASESSQPGVGGNEGSERTSSVEQG